MRDLTKLAVAIALGVLPLSSGGISRASADEAARVANSAVEPMTVPLSFANDILPVLSKLGCNSGSCHGRAIGQNGFKLSLFGFDPGFDYAALVHEGLGRRVSPAAPDDSLMLLKATGAMPHGGGVRMTADSESYRLLRRWIEQGSPLGRDDEPHDVKLEVTPDERIVQGKSQQQLRVVAHYSDGSTRDVTQIARFDTQHPDILTVTPDGLVQTTDRAGETSVMVRYQNCVATSRFVSLTEQAKPESAYAPFKPKNFVDELVLAKWRKLHIAPSSEAGDAEFLRRVFLDAMGTLPTPQEVRDFVADGAPDKRDTLIDRILEREEFFDQWAHRVGDLLRNRIGDSNAKDNTIAFAKWIRQSLVENKPYDQFVREIITVTGKRSDHPQMDWYRWAITNENRVEDTAQAFLGLRVSCANCHNHPFEKVSQGDYWQFAAFFARLKSVTYGSVDELSLNEKGEVKHPRTEKLLAPKAFGGPEFAYVAGEDPRAKLAERLTAADNPYFARAICNRVWGHYLGVGLVDPVDDMRATNPPSNPELMDALARDFVAHKFDLKHLMKTILKSRAYGLSSSPTDDNRADTRNYARYFSRRLEPHVLLDAISSATGVPQKFEDYPEIKKAILLPNEKARSEFLEIFGRSERTTPCECETSLAPNLSQVLYLLNSDELQRKLSAKDGVLDELAKPEKPNADVVEDLFLRTFSRLPRPDELQDAIKQIENEKNPNRRTVLEDLLWTLLNSKEFLFNH
ncbi:MAG: DUF1549 domain-containing protein [Planctomycetales bacterium]|nr:DUF1549 domain-containing protein [Planctomycetales bacterium]